VAERIVGVSKDCLNFLQASQACAHLLRSMFVCFHEGMIQGGRGTMVTVELDGRGRMKYL